MKRAEFEELYRNSTNENVCKKLQINNNQLYIILDAYNIKRKPRGAKHKLQAPTPKIILID